MTHCALVPAASALQLPVNPLHITAPSSSRHSDAEDDDDYEDYSPPQSSVTLHVLAPATRSARAMMNNSRKDVNAMLKAKAFFDQVINITAPSSHGEASSHPPRIIYIRDFLRYWVVFAINSIYESYFFNAFNAFCHTKMKGETRDTSVPA